MEQKNVLEVREKYQISQALDEQMKIVEQQILELQQFSDALEFLEKNKEKEILANIGKGVFVKSEIKEKEFFIDAGAGIFVKKKPEETKKIVGEQIGRLQRMKIQLESELFELNNEIVKVLENQHNY